MAHPKFQLTKALAGGKGQGQREPWGGEGRRRGAWLKWKHMEDFAAASCFGPLCVLRDVMMPTLHQSHLRFKFKKIDKESNLLYHHQINPLKLITLLVYLYLNY